MDLIAVDYYFYTDTYVTQKSYDSSLGIYTTDLEKYSPKIRIFGTEDQVEKAKNKYIKDTGYILNEAYNFKVEEKGSYWYNIYDNPIEHNKIVKTKLDYYRKRYDNNNCKPLIIGI